LLEVAQKTLGASVATITLPAVAGRVEPGSVHSEAA
jgi:hypothetical protein